MTGDELYINGVRADMGPSTGINLTWRSNLFADVSKIVGNNSTTIKLPATGHNIALIDGCIHPGRVSRYPYMRHAATVKRDGVEIVTGANLVLMKVGTDSIEVALTWGVSTDLARLQESDITLQDLDYRNTPNSGRQTWMRTRNSEFMPFADYGIRHDDDSVWNHPVIYVGDVLEAITQHYGVSFRFDTEPWRSGKWAIPLLQRNAESLTVAYTIANRIVGEATDGEYGYDLLGFYFNSREISTLDNSFYAFQYFMDEDHGMGDERWSRYGVPKRKGITQSPTGRVTVNIDGEENDIATCTLVLVTYVGDAVNVLLEFQPEGYTMTSPTSAMVTYVLDGSTSDPSTLGGGIFLDGAYTGYAIKGRNVHVYNPSGSITVRYSQDKVYLRGSTPDQDNPIMRGTWYQDSVRLYGADDGEYLTAQNMPKMKPIEFVKAIMQMAGKFAIVKDGEFYFYSYFRIFENLRSGDTYDWSGYLMQNRGWMPSALEFKVCDECQMNRMLYKDAEFGDGSTMNGYYIVENNTLNEARDSVSLPFVSYANRGTQASLKVYSYEYDTEVSEDGDEEKTVVKKTNFKNTDKPYIAVNRYDSGGYWYLTNQGITWQDLLYDFYGYDMHHEDAVPESYVGMLQEAKVQTEVFNLPGFMLNGIDLTRPVYISQFGAYFGIIEMKTRANNTIEAKLIKIK